MAEQMIHYLAYSRIEQRAGELKAEREKISVQLQEALTMGDLRENSEYDAAKDAMWRVVREIDSLTPSLGYKQAKANPNARVIEEGCVINITVYSVTNAPSTLQQVEDTPPIFKGMLMFGGVVPGLDLLRDHALSVETPIGSAILGKQGGFYSVLVPGGHANISVEKVMRDVTPEQLLAEPVFVG